MDEKKDILNLPNSLTVFRIALIPVLVFFLSSPSRGYSLIATAIFTIASTTDWLDGYIARKRGIVTTLGKFLDPVADKLLIASALIMLAGLGRIPAWTAVVIVGREIAVTGLRSIASSEGIVIAASELGKGKTIFQISALIGLIMHHDYAGIDFHYTGMALLWVALVMTAWSGIDYFYKFIKVIL